MGTTNKPNVMAGMKFTLLGTDLVAGFSNTNKGNRIFIHQDITAPNEGMTIGELIDDVNKLIMKASSGGQPPKLETKEIEDKLSPMTDSELANLNKIRITLRTVFLDITIPKDVNGEKKVDYAFCVEVNFEDVIPKRLEIDLFDIECITLAVWKTDNKEIKKQMALIAG